VAYPIRNHPMRDRGGQRPAVRKRVADRTPDAPRGSGTTCRAASFRMSIRSPDVDLQPGALGHAGGTWAALTSTVIRLPSWQSYIRPAARPSIGVAEQPLMPHSKRLSLTLELVESAGRDGDPPLSARLGTLMILGRSEIERGCPG
jgi:hypothetical protein